MKILGLVAGAALVVGMSVSGAAQSQPVKGVLMDNACASQHAADKAAVANHDKTCLLMDACVKSGYSVVTADGKVVKLDQKGNDLAVELVKKTNKDKNWAVSVDGKVTGDTVAVSSIHLQ